MRTGAAILGIFFGLGIFLVYSGFVVVEGITQDWGGESFLSSRVLYYGLPLLAIAGGIVTLRNGLIGGLMMIAGAVGIYLVGTSDWKSIGFDSFVLYFALPIALGGVLGILHEIVPER